MHQVAHFVRELSGPGER